MSPRIFFVCAIYDRQICVVLKEKAPLAHALHNYTMHIRQCPVAVQAKGKKMAETTVQLRKIGGKKCANREDKVLREECVNHKNVANL